MGTPPICTTRSPGRAPPVVTTFTIEGEAEHRPDDDGLDHCGGDLGVTPDENRSHLADGTVEVTEERTNLLLGSAQG